MMKRNLFLCFFLFSVCFVTMLIPPARAAFQVGLLPGEVSQGDAFVVRIEGLEGSRPQVYWTGSQLAVSDCGAGCFLAVGAAKIDLDPGTYPLMVRSGQKESVVKVMVKKASFPTISLTLPEKMVTLDPADLKRARDEEALLAALWTTESPKLWDGPFILPLPGGISTQFGCKRVLNGERISVHRGVDMRGLEGEPVKAVNRGRVVLASNLFFGGNTIILDHGMGIYSIYMHLSSFSVNVGDTVSAGDIVGLVGSTGRASGAHLHFSLKVGGVSTNPLSLIELPL